MALLLAGCMTPAGMVKVPGGAFQMGTDQVDEELEALNLGLPEPWYVDEHPFHTVKTGRFFIDRTEVTNEQYARYLATHPKVDAPDNWSRRRPPEGRDNHPVVYVSWFQAKHFCSWRNARLPTEAEWEKAARGTDARIYPWGNRFEPSYANVSSGPFDRGRTRAVGATPAGAGPYGTVDQTGNVWEWVDADYKAYPGNPDTVEAFSQPFKVMRGFSFEGVGHFMPSDYYKVVAISARASFRGYDHATARLRDVGFRCASDGK